MSGSARIGVHERVRPLIAAAVIIAAGLAARKWLGPLLGEHPGNVLWAWMWTALAASVIPRAAWWAAPTVGLAICAAIECVQLTSVPHAAAQVWAPSRWLLGYGFDWMDLLGNAAGAVTAGAFLWWLSARRESARAKTQSPQNLRR